MNVISTNLGAINSDKTVFLVCDMQEKFRPVIAHFVEITANAKKLIDAAKVLEVPLIVTEQYPQGLGSTVNELELPKTATVVSKTMFSMCVAEVDQAMETIANAKNTSIEIIVLFGCETHVCVEQTAIDLLERGYKVHVVADATSSRSLEDRHLAFQRLRQIGCFVSTSESIIFKLIKDKTHPKFNEIRLLIKDISLNTNLVSKS